MPSKDKKQAERRDNSGKSEMAQRLKTRPFIFIGTIFILVIVVIAFVFVPAMVPDAGGGADFTFGFYNRVPIQIVSDNFFDQTRRSLEWQHQHMLSNDPHNFMRYWIWRGAFEQAAVHIGIQDEMRRAGFVVHNDVVDREMARQFQRDGRFDAASYRAMDSASRMNMWRQIRDSIAVNRYLMDLANIGISSQEVSFIGSMASPRRAFSLAVFPLDSFPNSEVIAFAESNPDQFRVTRLSRITANTEWEAAAIRDRVVNDIVTFEEAARTGSLDAHAEMGGYMGMRMAYELQFDIWDLEGREHVFNLASGEISDIVMVSMGWGATGWAFFRAEQAIQPVDTNDPVQIDRIRSHLVNTMRGTIEDWVMTEAENFAAAVRERDFEEVAAEGNILRRNFGPIPVNFGNSALFSAVNTAGVPEIQNAGHDLFFWNAAFSTPLMTPSEPFVIGDNVMILFPLEESFADEEDVRLIELFYPTRIMEHLDEASRNFFLTSERLDDRFDETFWRLWRTN